MWVLIVGVILLAVYAVAESRWIRPVFYEVTVANLPPEFDGFSILHLSDLHGRVGVFSHPRFRQWIASADLVAVTGDLYQPGLSRRPVMQALDRMRQQCPALLVSGNHDYHHHGKLFFDPLVVEDWLLDNRAVAIQRQEAKLWVAGVPDLVMGRPNWTKMLSEIGPGPAILLSHRPDGAMLPPARRFQLVLSGHTHGGQIVLPGLGALLKHNHVGQGYVAGLRQLPWGSVLITSRGLGTSELPMRFLCRPELVKIVLKRSTQAALAEDITGKGAAP